MGQKKQKARQRKRRRAVTLFIVLVLIGAGTYASMRLRAGGGQDAAALTKDRYHTVQRGDFTINVLLEGTLSAIKTHDIKCKGRGRHGLEIIEIVEDRTHVQTNDVIVKFSTDKYDLEGERLDEQLEDQERSLRFAQEDLEMVETENRNSVKFGSDSLRSARQELTRYVEQDGPEKRRGLLASIHSADQGYDQARQASRNATAALAEANTKSETNRETLEKSVKDAKNKIEQASAARTKALDALQMFKRYDHPKRLRELREGLTRRYMQLQRELVRAAGGIIRSKKNIQRHVKSIQRTRDEIGRLVEDVKGLVLKAPVAGIVSLGNPRRRSWEEHKEMKVGAKVHPREVIASIPDLSQFVCSVNVPEEFRSRIKVGLPVLLKCRAIPDLILKGQLTAIAPMARHAIEWDRNSPKSYLSKVSTDGANEQLMPGMTMRVEIQVEEVTNVLFVPVESLFNRKGKTVCMVRTLTGLKKREVTAGRSSRSYVEVLSGLEEGDNVFLHREGEPPGA